MTDVQLDIFEKLFSFHNSVAMIFEEADRAFTFAGPVIQGFILHAHL